jgi:Na+/H+-dicarboxylate symporter
MDGTAIYQGVCAIFIASCFGIDLTLGQMATIVITATLASIGTAGVPGAGMVMLAMVLLTAYISYALHAILVYSTTVRTLGGISPIRFFKEMAPAMIFAFSSASSVGTLPLNMECCEKLGADKETTAFVLPLGATINMDGTAIYQGVCAIFIASCFGIDLTLSQMATIVITATLASIGTAGVPGAGMVMLAMVLTSVGLPVEGIALVAGVDRIFDMGRTVLNITGDASCAVIVSNLERKKEAKKLAKASKE